MGTPETPAVPESEAEEAADDGAEAEYPPETFRYMSWSAIRFINRPTLRPLAWTCHGLLLALIAGLVSAWFIQLDVRVEAPGEIVADPGVLQVVAQTDDLMAAPAKKAGQAAVKGEVLGLLQMELSEEDLSRMLAALDANPGLIEAAGRKKGLDPAVETGQLAAGVHDAAVREAGMALQSAVRRLQKSLSSLGAFEADKGEAIRLSQQLKGTLASYLEAHRLRSPANGDILQYEAPVNSQVHKGQAVATILPQGATLVAKLLLDAKDVPNVAVGQRVRHKVEAYPFQRYGLFEGEVLSIERAGQDKGDLRYEVRAAVRRPPALSERLARDVRLVMGMKLDSQIVTGKRTLYDILADSLFGQR